ncbi:MAG: N-acetyltransferase [Calothrix sp. C42_A2020_038]|nr:N-acetyltransferase [Calothrix sp. C42_A2020_038]
MCSQLNITVIVRPETSADYAAIGELTERAFRDRWYSSKTEHHIINALRRVGALSVSLVAEQNSKVVGHIAFSPAKSSDGSDGWFSLGPISVEPELQGKGIGELLVRTGLQIIQEQGAKGCILVGDIGYYKRFGFINVPELAPEAEFASYFHILRFNESTRPEKIEFHPVFHDTALINGN